MKTKSAQFGELTGAALAIVRKAADHKSVARELVTFLCRWFDCSWGTYWHVDPAKRVLNPAFSWSDTSLAVERLRKDTDIKSLTPGEGTAGLVWRSGRPVCTGNIVRDMCLPRSVDAREAGLRGGLWFPIRHEHTTYAVVELLGRHQWSCDQQFIAELDMLGAALGEAHAHNLARTRNAHSN